MVGLPFKPQWAKYPLVPLALALAAGIALQRLTGLPYPGVVALLAGTALLLLIAWKWKKDHLFFISVLAFFAVMGMVRYAHWRAASLDVPYAAHLPLSLDGCTATVRSVQEGSRLRAIAALDEMQGSGGQVIPSTGQILVEFPYRFRGEVVPGQRLLLKQVELEALPAPRNPGQFDYGAYLRDRGIAARVRLREDAQIHDLSPERAFTLESAIFFPARKSLERRLDACFSPTTAGILKALLLGVREDLSRHIREDFQNAGVMHVLAISGLHVGFVWGVLHWVLSFFPLYFKTRNWLIVGFLVAYMLLTGSHPPVVRATLMAVFILAATNLERRGAVWNSLFAAAAIILLFQPQQLFWVGFQLSFAAVLSIVYFFPLLSGWFRPLFDRIDREKNRNRLNKWLVAPFCLTMAAQIGTVPLVMHYFHKFSLISIFLNLLVIPLTGLIVMTGFGFLALSLASAPLAAWVARGVELLLKGMLLLVDWAADLPGAFFNIAAFGWSGIGLYLAAVLLIFKWHQAPLRGLFGGALLGLLVMGGAANLTLPRGLDVLMLDVGQGDAALVRTAQDITVLIDAGPADENWSAGDGSIIPALQHLGTSRVHKLFISHPHMDHFGGVFRLLKYARVDTVYLPPIPVVEPPVDSLLRTLATAGIPQRILQQGDVVRIDAETRVYVLGPAERQVHYAVPSGKNVNNASLVLLLKHRDQTLLFPGDAEAEAEADLRKWGALLRSDFLKVAHHGSETSSTPGFLSQVRPRFAGISVGRWNRFGHPSPIVIRRLETIRAEVFRTDRDRAIWLRCQNGKWERVSWD